MDESEGEPPTTAIQQTYTILPQANAAPSLTPTIHDAAAPYPTALPGLQGFECG
jgi:alpha-glucosidase